MPSPKLNQLYQAEHRDGVLRKVLFFTTDGTRRLAHRTVLYDDLKAKLLQGQQCWNNRFAHSANRLVRHSFLRGKIVAGEIRWDETDAITDEADRRLIIGIDSETDHLPIGEVRKLWAPDALQEKDAEIARAEEWWKAKFLDACRRIAGS